MRDSIKIFLIFLLTACMTSCTSPKEESSGAMSDAVVDTAVTTITVSTSSFTRMRSYVGNVEASKSVKIIPLASERILKYPWENGDYVKQGEVIAEIRNEVNKKGLDALNAQMKSLSAQLSAAEREYKRVQSMYESNIVSRQNFDQAQDAVTTLQASKLQLQASLQQSKLGLDYARVVAPISGVVSQKNSEVGDIASSAMPLCVLLDLTNLKVTLNVNEEDSTYLKIGQDVKLRFDAFPGEVITAKITRIMPYVNTTTRTNTVEAEFPNVEKGAEGQYKFKPGMYARAELSLETTNDAITVPPSSLILDPDLLSQQVTGQTLRKAYVMKSDSTVESRIVEVGEQNGNIIEVLKGLNVGDKLVTRGQHSLQDGDHVRERNSDAHSTIATTTVPSASNAKNAEAAVNTNTKEGT